MTEKFPELSKLPFQVKLVWGATDKLETTYANQLAVTRTENEYYLVFGEMTMPVIFNPDSVPNEFEIVPKIRIAVGHNAMKAFVEVLSKYVSSIEEG